MSAHDAEHGASVRAVETASRPRERLLRACAAFGMAARRVTRAQAAARWRGADARAACLDERAPMRRLTLVLGPSGAGKSTLLRALERRLRSARRAVVVARRPRGAGRRRALVDAVPGPLRGALRALASAGLGEAPLLGRSLGALSDGERARAVLAVAMARAELAAGSAPPGAGGEVTVLVDEFTSGLDALCAQSVALGLARWCERAGNTRVIAASSREELCRWCAGRAEIVDVQGV